MISLLRKFTEKIISQSLSAYDKILFLAIDDEIYSYGGLQNPRIRDAMFKIFDLMEINSLLVALPGPPYNLILRELLRWGKTEGKKVIPEDCETRTFFHDIPVVDLFDSSLIYRALSERKSVIVEDGPAIVSYGTVSPEQAFVSFSSTCFSTFVKYFYDSLLYLRGTLRDDRERPKVFDKIRSYIRPVHIGDTRLAGGIPSGEDELVKMLTEAGRLLIEKRLVDSYFGNISACMNDTIYISETSASLDELEGAIDAVPIDGSSSVGITASSEFPTHRAIYRETAYRFILHGHPKFSVIMSMYCEKEDCPLRGECYRRCPEKRFLCGTPIVPGEIGTGRTGIVNTVPAAFRESDAVIVYGHGLFAAGMEDFNHPFQRLVEIENCAMETYFRTITIQNGQI